MGDWGSNLETIGLWVIIIYGSLELGRLAGKVIIWIKERRD